MPRPYSWQVPSPGHRPAGQPDPAERLAVPVVAELDREGSREGQGQGFEGAAPATGFNQPDLQ